MTNNDYKVEVSPQTGQVVMPIAIIGMSCRFPGGITDPEKLWEFCSESQNAWTPFPPERFRQSAFYHPNPERRGTMNAQGGHFLKEDISRFDAAFFNITPTEAKAIDPQQRLQLESAYEAIENAGIPLEKLAGSNTSVYIGLINGDYEQIQNRDQEDLPLYHATGTSRAVAANRISHAFDLTGPSITIDTACSSSLVALHLACQSLRSGECQQAIVGGTNLIMHPDMMMAMSQMRFFSPEGKCYAFDHRASGYGRGEGVACIILKPLSTAIQSGDPIRAIIRNTAINQDGHTAGLTLPSSKAQESLIRFAYKQAQLDFATTAYVEAHGTGTVVGDPAEVTAIANVFETAHLPTPMYIGSVKTNIGHLEGASGLAGLIKTVLMLEKGQILPNVNFEKGGERMALEARNLIVPTSLQPWPTQGLRRASVNSFGFGGTNAHVILDDAQNFISLGYLDGIYQKHKRVALANRAMRQSASRRLIFVLSRRDPTAVRDISSNLSVFLTESKTLHTVAHLKHLSYTLSTRRSLLPCREAISASSVHELSTTLVLRAFPTTQRQSLARIGFIFTGQGAQWAAMGRELMHVEPVYEASLRAAGKHLASLGAKWSLLDKLCKDPEQSRLDRATISQPLYTTVQLALVDLLAHWNVTPTAVIGHSSGEIAAAYAAGYLTFNSALVVSYYQGQIVERLQQNETRQRSGMLAVGLSRKDANSYL